MDGDTTARIGEPVESPADIQAMGAQIRDVKKRGPKTGAKWSKYGEYTKVFTLRGNPAVMEKIHVIAELEALPIQVVVDQALRVAIERYEAEHGPIDEDKIREMEEKVSSIREGTNVIFK